MKPTGLLNSLKFCHLMFPAHHFKKFLFILIALSLGSCNSTDSNKPATSSDISGDQGPIISERIDGSANVRDGINGILLFSLNDNVAVTANAPKNGWLQIGIQAELNQQLFDGLFISKGSKIIADGKEIGKAIENIK